MNTKAEADDRYRLDDRVARPCAVCVATETVSLDALDRLWRDRDRAFFAVMVPTMCRAREPANRIKCSSNLRQIGLAIRQYADHHGGVLPADWADLAAAEELTDDAFICPTSTTEDRAPAQPAVDWHKGLNDPAAHHCSYRYAGRGLVESRLDKDDILAFEPAENHVGAGLNLLFADGHVDWQNAQSTDKPAYDKLLADYTADVRPLRLRP